VDRITYIDHKGKTIVYINFSDCRSRDVRPVIDDAKKILAHQTPGSVLTLINVTEMMFDKKTKDMMQELATHNRLFAKAEAVIGASGILKVIYDTILADKKNKIRLFDTQQAAKDWLAEQ
jgi:hypothetical protein